MVKMVEHDVDAMQLESDVQTGGMLSSIGEFEVLHDGLHSRHIQIFLTQCRTKQFR